MLKIKNSLGEKRMIVDNSLDKKSSIKVEEHFKNPKIKSINPLEGMKMRIKEGGM